VRETSFAFGPDGILVGTVCLPEEGSPANVGMVLFNAGLVHRIGPHRINVRLARKLAASGIPSIRFDLSGQGDSGRRAGSTGFEEQVFQDIASAMDALAGKAGVSRFSLFGFCSGGVHSFAVAQREPRIAGVVLYDTYLYPNVLSQLYRYFLSIRDRGFALAVTDWIHRKIAGTDRKAPTGANGMDSFPTPSRAEFAEVILRLSARGTRVAVIYSGSFAQHNYDRQFRDTFGRYGFDHHVTCDYFPALGHSTTILTDQQVLIDRIVDWTRDLDISLRAPDARP